MIDVWEAHFCIIFCHQHMVYDDKEGWVRLMMDGGSEGGEKEDKKENQKLDLK